MRWSMSSNACVHVNCCCRLFTVGVNSSPLDVIYIASFIPTVGARESSFGGVSFVCNGWLSFLVDASTNVHRCLFMVQPFVDNCLPVLVFYNCVFEFVFCERRKYLSRGTRGCFVGFVYFFFTFFSCSTHSSPRTQKHSTVTTPTPATSGESMSFGLRVSCQQQKPYS